MSERSPDLTHEQIRELLDSLYRVDSRRILATLIRLLGDFDLAEEAMHEAFAAALSLWSKSGVPGNPRPWLISTARFKAVDTLRRRARFFGYWKPPIWTRYSRGRARVPSPAMRWARCANFYSSRTRMQQRNSLAAARPEGHPQIRQITEQAQLGYFPICNTNVWFLVF